MKKNTTVMLAVAISLMAASNVWAGADDTYADNRNPNDGVSTKVSEYLPETEALRVLTFGDYSYVVNQDERTVTIQEYTGTEEVVEIPAEIDGYQVAGIEAQAFSYGKMKQVIFPDSLQRIGQRAFEYCEITQVMISAEAVVESCAFGYCDALQTVLVGEDAVIESRAFGYCDALGTVVCARGSRLESNTFEYCRGLKKGILCGEVKVDEDAFYDCDQMEVIREQEGEYENWKESEKDPLLADPALFLTGGMTGALNPQTQTEALEDGEHRITLAGDLDVFVDCPSKAKAGETVTVLTADVTDGEVKLAVNGADTGRWEAWGTYSFIMPDTDTEVKGWISTEGYPGA